MDTKDKIIAKQDELLKLLLRNYTSEFYPMKKETYIKRVKQLRSELASLKSELSESELKQPDPLLKESGGKLNKTAEEIFGKIAKKYEFNSWREMIWIANRNRREEYIIEAINHAVKYTSQFQEQPITVTEDIISAKLDSMNFETSKEREDAYDIAEWVLSLKAQKD